MLKNSEWRAAEPSDNPCSSEDVEYSDALEVAASAGTGILVFSKVCFVRIQSRGYRNRKPI